MSSQPPPPPLWLCLPLLVRVCLCMSESVWCQQRKARWRRLHQCNEEEPVAHPNTAHCVTHLTSPHCTSHHLTAPHITFHSYYLPLHAFSHSLQRILPLSPSADTKQKPFVMFGVMDTIYSWMDQHITGTPTTIAVAAAVGVAMQPLVWNIVRSKTHPQECIHTHLQKTAAAICFSFSLCFPASAPASLIF